MSSRARRDLCRICGGDLQGNQRRWLFGGQNKRSGQPRTPTESVRGGGLSRSSQSSPWGSTASLGSSGSLSQVSASPQSKAVDLLSVLTHILGQSVPRGAAAGEFVCGKCASALERVFRLDAVMARVRLLSNERLQTLTKERDKIRVWVRQNYRHRHPQSPQTGPGGETEKEGYRDMLRDNMSLWQYEWWSDRWDTCPFFIRTGKRCREGRGCEGCNSLRVSDSDYESVCGIPRHLPFQPSSPLGLSRDRSQSMPLHWQGVPSVHSSPASLAGSSPSLRGSSRTGSVQSLDSVDGPFDSPEDRAVSLLLRELRGLEGKAVRSPSGSRIPVLQRSAGRDGSSTPTVSRSLSFEDLEGPGDQVDGEDGDVLTELRDEYMPLHRESATSRVHSAMKHLRAQLDQATSRIRTLEAELRGGGGGGEVNGSEELLSEDDSFLLQSFCHSLRSRERLIQECLALIRGLGLQDTAGSELSSKLTENLKELLSDNKAALETLRSETLQKEENLQKEVEALRRTGRDLEGDLDLLHTVLQNSQDLVNDLRAALEEKERLLKEVEKERELWRQRDGALAAVLKDKEVLIRNLKQQLDTETPSSTVIGQQPSVGGADGEENTCLCQEVTKLTAALQETQEQLQAERQSHSQTAASLTARLSDLQQELREKQKERKEAERRCRNQQEDAERRERKLREDLMKRDKLIEILLDAEERDHLFQELQQNLQNKREPVTAVRHRL